MDDAGDDVVASGDPLDDAALADIIRAHEPEDLAEVLVQQAIEHGTEDNVTVVVVHIQP